MTDKQKQPPIDQITVINMAGWVAGISKLLIDKGITDADEIATYVAYGKAKMDQMYAEKRDERKESP